MSNERHDKNLDLLQVEIRKITTACGKCNKDIKSVEYAWLDDSMHLETGVKTLAIEFFPNAN